MASSTNKQRQINDVLDNILEGCQIISHDFKYLYVNDAVAKQGKTTKEKLLGHTIMEKYPGIDKTPMFAKLRECMDKKKVILMENEFTFPDGSKGWFELRMEPLPEGAIILSLDITERKRAEEHLKELDKLKSTFIDIISHQLRTPLSSIKWNLEELLASADSQMSEKQKEITRLAYSSSSEVNNRINDLLIAVDIEENRIIPNKEKIQIASLLKSVLKQFEKAIQVKNLKLKIKYPSKNLPAVEADPKLIREVLAKLIDNAITYSSEGGSLTITLSKKDKNIHLGVTDTGIGIPDYEKDKVFNRFYRASNAFTIKPDASGLGLYIAKSYIELHDGKIGLKSKEGKSSTFRFELPTI